MFMVSSICFIVACILYYKENKRNIWNRRNLLWTERKQLQLQLC
jgi:hypothetical protein